MIEGNNDHVLPNHLRGKWADLLTAIANATSASAVLAAYRHALGWIEGMHDAGALTASGKPDLREVLIQTEGRARKRLQAGA